MIQRAGRVGSFRASLVGYTNAGKSSILRGISGASEVFVEDRLFATLDPLTREVDLGDHQSVLLTDTVGFIRKLPHHLVASFRATLEEVSESDLLLHVIDASHPSWEEQRLVVDDVLADLGVQHLPMTYLFHKIDRLTPESAEGLRERMANLAPGSLFTSTATPEGMEPLRTLLRDTQRARRPEVEILVAITDGGLLAEAYRLGEVLDATADADAGVMRLRGRFDVAAMARLERDGAVRA